MPCESNAPIADYCIIFAITDPERAAARRGGISAFLVPTDAPGFEVQRVIKLFGHIGGDEAELRFEDLKVEPWQLVGKLHEGFATALYGVGESIHATARRRRLRAGGCIG